MDFLVTVDEGINNATRMFFLILGLWGTFSAIRGQGVSGSYFGSLLIGEILYIVQLLLDLFLWLNSALPLRAGLHYLYAIFAVLLIPFVFTSVLKGDESNRAQWVYAFICLFLWGIASRAITTGS